MNTSCSTSASAGVSRACAPSISVRGAVRARRPQHCARAWRDAVVRADASDRTDAAWLQVQLDQLRRILVSEEYQYSDPVTDFVKAVYVDYDFARAQVRAPCLAPPAAAPLLAVLHDAVVD